MAEIETQVGEGVRSPDAHAVAIQAETQAGEVVRSPTNTIAVQIETQEGEIVRSPAHGDVSFHIYSHPPPSPPPRVVEAKSAPKSKSPCGSEPSISSSHLSVSSSGANLRLTGLQLQAAAMPEQTETQTLEAGEIVRSPAAHAVALHFHVHAPPPPPPPPQPAKKPAEKKQEEKKPEISYPYDEPVGSGTNTASVHLVPAPLRTICNEYVAPIAVAIGPYHRRSNKKMNEAKEVARDEFCRAAGQPQDVIQEIITSLVADAKGCYSGSYVHYIDDNRFAEMMFMDGCFLLQFMACMCPDNRGDTPPVDGLWAKVHARVDAIVRDIMLLENQLPWLVLQALKEFTPTRSWQSVDRFLDLMARTFDVGIDDVTTRQHGDIDLQPPPPHLLGLFYRRQVGEPRTKSLRVPRVSSLATAVELAEMGVKITSRKARVFGDMTMTKRRHCLGLYGQLTLAPVVLNALTASWLFSMLAHEACLGAACVDNFAVSSYISAVALLMNRPEDVQELRGKGVVVSEFSDHGTLKFFKEHAACVRVGYRYYDVFKRLHEYRKERWVWIAVHSFLYRNLKTIIAVISVAGVLAGLFKTILSIKQPQRG